jgi:hypothetical protein
MHIEEQGEAAADWPHFVVGRDQQARWIVIETHGLCGGVFRDQAAALRYAEEECQAYQADFEISREPLSLKFP